MTGLAWASALSGIAVEGDGCKAAKPPCLDPRHTQLRARCPALPERVLALGVQPTLERKGRLNTGKVFHERTTP